MSWRAVAGALGERRRRSVAAAAAGGYLVAYLLAIQDIRVTPGRDLRRFVDVPGFELVPGWVGRMFQQAAPFEFEPVAVVYPVNHVTVFVAPLNLVMGVLLGALVGVNVAVAWRLVTGRACRTDAFGGLLGALPALLGGFFCRVPAVALLVGAQLTVALVAVRSWLYPLAVVALAAGLWWNARRLARLEQAPAGQPHAREATAA